MERDIDFDKPIAEIEKMIQQLKAISEQGDDRLGQQIRDLEQRLLERKREIYATLTPWQTVQLARHPKRPILQDYIELAFTDFLELHGDRRFADDQALIGGFAMLDDIKVMLIGHNKGRNVEENVKRNFAQARPEGYRKALRLMQLAEKFNLPVVTLVDTQGAYPGLDAEERGQAEAIARNLTEMARLEVPIVTVITGEGGSGGALGIGVGNVVMMLSHAVYSVISPEGCASILWRDSSFSAQAAEALKITAPALKELGVIDEVIPEPLGGAHTNLKQTAENLKIALVKHVKRLAGHSPSRLVAHRFEKYSRIGAFAG